MSKCSGHQFTNAFIFEKADSASTIETGLDCSCIGSLQQFLFAFQKRPAGTTRLFDNPLALSQLIAHILRKGVGNPEGDEIQSAIFVPMWQAPAISDCDFAKAGAGRPHDSRRDGGAPILFLFVSHAQDNIVCSRLASK